MPRELTAAALLTAALRRIYDRSHLAGQVGARVKVTLEIEAELPEGAPDNVVRTVSENARTLKFKSAGFEEG